MGTVQNPSIPLTSVRFTTRTKLKQAVKRLVPQTKVNEQRLLTEAECVGLKVGDITGLLNTRHNAFRHLDYILGFEKGNEQRKKNPDS